MILSIQTLGIFEIRPPTVIALVNGSGKVRLSSLMINHTFIGNVK